MYSMWPYIFYDVILIKLLFAADAEKTWLECSLKLSKKARIVRPRIIVFFCGRSV
jgi:hypothetical protein